MRRLRSFYIMYSNFYLNSNWFWFLFSPSCYHILSWKIQLNQFSISSVAKDHKFVVMLLSITLSRSLSKLFARNASQWTLSNTFSVFSSWAVRHEYNWAEWFYEHQTYESASSVMIKSIFELKMSNTIYSYKELMSTKWLGPLYFKNTESNVENVSYTFRNVNVEAN